MPYGHRPRIPYGPPDPPATRTARASRLARKEHTRGHPCLDRSRAVATSAQPRPARPADAARARHPSGAGRREAPGRAAGPGALVAVLRALVAARRLRSARARGDADREAGGADRAHAQHRPPGDGRGLPVPAPIAAGLPGPGPADVDL